MLHDSGHGKPLRANVNCTPRVFQQKQANKSDLCTKHPKGVGPQQYKHTDVLTPSHTECTYAWRLNRGKRSLSHEAHTQTDTHLKIWQRKQELAVEAAWATQGPIDGINSIGGSNYDHLYRN